MTDYRPQRVMELREEDENIPKEEIIIVTKPAREGIIDYSEEEKEN